MSKLKFSSTYKNPLLQELRDAMDRVIIMNECVTEYRHGVYTASDIKAKKLIEVFDKLDNVLSSR